MGAAYYGKRQKCFCLTGRADPVSRWSHFQKMNLLMTLVRKELSMEFSPNNKLFFYLSAGAKAAVLEYTYILTVPVDPAVLRLAVRDAVTAFPASQLKPVITPNGTLSAVLSDLTAEDMPVYQYDGSPVRLGSKDTNGYLFRVCWSDNRITLSASHGIGDARGVNSFMQTIVYYYLTRLGYEIDTEGLVYTTEDLSDSSITDSLVEKAKAIYSPDTENPEPDEVSPAADPDAVFYPPEQKIYLKTPQTRYFEIILDNGKFIDAVKSFGGTPLTFVHAAAAETMYDFYKITDKNIVANVPVDLRTALGSRAQSNFTFNVNLNISGEDLHLDTAALMKTLRSRLKKAAELNRMLGGIAASDAYYAYFDGISLNDDTTLKAFSDYIVNLKPTRTYLLSNIGKIALPEDMSAFVSDIDFVFPVVESTPVLSMITYKNRASLIVAQNYEDDGFIEALRQTFAKYGIETGLNDRGLILLDDVKIMDFPREPDQGALPQ